MTTLTKAQAKTLGALQNGATLTARQAQPFFPVRYTLDYRSEHGQHVSKTVPAAQVATLVARGLVDAQPLRAFFEGNVKAVALPLTHTDTPKEGDAA